MPSRTLTHPAPTIPDFISQADAAQLLGVSVHTLRRRIADGTIPAYRIGRTSTIRLRRSDIEAALRPVLPGQAV